MNCRLKNKERRNRGLISSWNNTPLLAMKLFKIKRFLYPLCKRQSFSAKEADNLICALLLFLGRGAGGSRVPSGLPHTWPPRWWHKGEDGAKPPEDTEVLWGVFPEGDGELWSLLCWLQKQPEDAVWALGQTIAAAWTTQGVILSEGASCSSDLSFPEQKHWFISSSCYLTISSKKKKKGGRKITPWSPYGLLSRRLTAACLCHLVESWWRGFGCLRAQRGPVVWGCCGTPLFLSPFFQQHVLDTADAGSHMQAAGVLQRRGERVRKLQTWWCRKQVPALSGGKLNLASWKQRKVNSSNRSTSISASYYTAITTNKTTCHLHTSSL